jgi:UDP:flavonoid glycosyltransferase YjiC (YdhE family)
VDSLPPLPANARAATFLPYDSLLPKTDVFVTNGGYGGVQYALRYGVPVITTSGHEDKPEVAARIAWSGAGRRLKPPGPPPPRSPPPSVRCSRIPATAPARRPLRRA